MTTHAATAKAIRQELKSIFPTVKFSVTSDSFAGGDAVRISYTDGPTRKEVETITGKYQYGSFDGMQDLYEYDNCRKDVPQTKYVQVSRDYSQAAKETAIVKLGFEPHQLNEWNDRFRAYNSEVVCRELASASL